jgi:hypothetical protein
MSFCKDKIAENCGGLIYWSFTESRDFEIFSPAGGPPFHTTQTKAVEFPGAASLRFLKGAGLDAALSTSAAKHIPQVISTTRH